MYDTAIYDSALSDDYACNFTINFPDVRAWATKTLFRNLRNFMTTHSPQWNSAVKRRKRGTPDRLETRWSWGSPDRCGPSRSVNTNPLRPVGERVNEIHAWKISYANVIYKNYFLPSALNLRRNSKSTFKVSVKNDLNGWCLTKT